MANKKEPEAKYHWKDGEGISEGLQRIVAEELELALWHLSARAGSLDHAVHEARKSLKRIRSALRLVQEILGQQYGEVNTVLRDAGLKLSPVRDSQALIEVFDELNGKHREKLGDRSVVSVRDGLVARKEKLSSDFLRKRVRSSVLKSLREVAAHVKKWHLEDVDSGIVSKGFARTIQRNRKACEEAYAGSHPEGFHEWRKRAKDLRYHLGLVSKAWPVVLNGYENAAKELESKLGDDHNLVVLRNTIMEKPGNFGEEQDISAFLKIVDHHQQKLRSDSKSLATRLYSEKPRDWRRRLDLCWSVWKEEAR